jgi:VIT1/CCC1 family predicted Fe2+/Mn2+ transporter
MSSAAAFAAGAVLPLVTAVFAPPALAMPLIAGLSLVFLAVLGAIAARVGHASIATGTLRVTFWGAIAMALTAAIGSIFGVVA